MLKLCTKLWDSARAKQRTLTCREWSAATPKCFVVRSGLKVENAKYLINGLIFYKQSREMMSGHRGLDSLGFSSMADTLPLGFSSQKIQQTSSQ